MNNPTIKNSDINKLQKLRKQLVEEKEKEYKESLKKRTETEEIAEQYDPWLENYWRQF